uniref:Uncharacterized protein n=1 Tax=Aegilops tauschii subsp. strangulata TaxID=200361 RepID=A0A453FB59_AEGTS
MYSSDNRNALSTVLPEFESKHPFQLGCASLEHNHPNSHRTIAVHNRPLQQVNRTLLLVNHNWCCQKM